jgi:radical SAM superfamily enzyme with C-terminal helix-hairpin-helix motif
MEIESQTGCNRKPGCTFCIESIRGLPNTSRDVDDITAEIKALYDKKIRNFRIGRQPNFYSYQDSSPEEIERLFRGIWNECPELRTLHIDNVSPHNVITSKGRQVSELVAKYCTSGNIGSFGIESFDVRIREINNLNGTIAEIHKAIRILNEVGSQQGEQGTRIFLPGINIIYGLEGQSDITLSENFKHFDSILGNYYVRRVFVRNLTSPHGKQFGENQFKESLDEWKRQITERFSLPMLKKVYPLGTILKNERVEMVENGNSILRQMGTCPEKIVLKNKKLNLDDFYTVKITGYRNDRTMEGEILCKE